MFILSCTMEALAVKEEFWQDGAMAINMLKDNIKECMEAGYFRKDINPDEISLILLRQKCRRHPRIQPAHRAYDHCEQQHVARGSPNHASHDALIPIRRLREAPVEPAEESTSLVMCAFRDWAQQRRAQCGRQ